MGAHLRRLVDRDDRIPGSAHRRPADRVAVYGLVLGGTAAFSARCQPLVAVGGAFFLASDTILALRLFLPDSLPPWSSPAVMITYTIGQGLIVAGALIALRKRNS